MRAIKCDVCGKLVDTGLTDDFYSFNVRFGACGFGFNGETCSSKCLKKLFNRALKEFEEYMSGDKNEKSAQEKDK